MKKKSNSPSWPMFMGVVTSSSLLGFVMLGFQNCSTIHSTTITSDSQRVERSEPKVAQANCSDFATVLPPETFSETCLAALQAQIEVGLVDSYKNLVEYSSTGKENPTLGEIERYWIYVPQGRRIDITDEGQWTYPVGTRLWQEISREGQKVETREMEKLTSGIGILAWRFSSYLWRTDQSDAVVIKSKGDQAPKNYPEELLLSHLSPKYNVVQLNRCNSCHTGSKDSVLGLKSHHLSSFPTSWTSLRRAGLDKKETAAD